MLIMYSAVFLGCSFSSEEKITFYLPEFNKNFEYEVYKNLPYPCIYTSSNGITYGAIYPYSMELKKEDGFSASVLYSLYAGTENGNSLQVGKYLANFNWQRFIEECRKIENPWMLDKSRIMKKIAAGTFSKNDLKYIDH